MWSPSSIPAACRDFTWSLRTCPSAVTSRSRKPCPNDSWARTIRSPTLEDSKIASCFPLSAGQSHIDLKHLLRIIFTLSSPLETLAHKQLTQQTWQCHPWIISSFSHEIHRAIPGKGCRATLPSLIKAFFSFAASESGESFVRRGPTTISGTIIYIIIAYNMVYGL